MKRRLTEKTKGEVHISSPEELHDYMHVTGPGLWIVLSVIMVLLVGLIVYAATTEVENTMPLKLTLRCINEADTQIADETERGGTGQYTYAFSRLPISQRDSVEIGMTVRMGDEEGKLCSISVDEDTLYLDIEMEDVYIPLPDGEYDAELVLNTTSPINYLFR